MKRDEALALVRSAEGRVCVRFWRRADGTVITSDCPVGLAAKMKRKVRLALAGLVAMALGILGATIALRRASGTPFGSVYRWIAGEPEQEPVVYDGKMSIVVPPAPSPAPGE
jgi:hypothetical protein